MPNLPSLTRFTYAALSISVEMPRSPDLGNDHTRELQLTVLESASGEQSSFSPRIPRLRMSLAYRGLKTQEQCDLEFFYAEVVRESIRRFDLTVNDPIIPTPFAAGQTINGTVPAAGQNLNTLDPCLPALPLQAGRFYRAQDQLIFRDCYFQKDSLQSRNGKKGADVSFVVICELPPPP